MTKRKQNINKNRHEQLLWIEFLQQAEVLTNDFLRILWHDISQKLTIQLTSVKNRLEDKVKD